MRVILVLALATTLFVLMCTGTVVNLLIIIGKVYGSVSITKQMLFWLYALAALIVIGLMWLLVKIGAV